MWLSDIRRFIYSERHNVTQWHQGIYLMREIQCDSVTPGFLFTSGRYNVTQWHQGVYLFREIQCDAVTSEDLSIQRETMWLSDIRRFIYSERHNVTQWHQGIYLFREKQCDSVKWNESGFRPPLCTYRLNWARKTSWGWWDDWDDTVLQTQDSKFEPWRSEAEHATSRSRRLPAILTFTRGWGRNIFVSFKPPSPGTEPRTLAWKAAVLTTTLGP